VDLRPNINAAVGSQKYIAELMFEIEKYQKKVELMRLKMEFKD
jgi:hypothetical protein